MSVSGLCQICEARTAQHRCESCGSLVCEKHFEMSLGLCVDCAGKARPDQLDDTDVHRF